MPIALQRCMARQSRVYRPSEKKNHLITIIINNRRRRRRRHRITATRRHRHRRRRRCRRMISILRVATFHACALL